MLLILIPLRRFDCYCYTSMCCTFTIKILYSKWKMLFEVTILMDCIKLINKAICSVLPLNRRTMFWYLPYSSCLCCVKHICLIDRKALEFRTSEQTIRIVLTFQEWSFGVQWMSSIVTNITRRKALESCVFHLKTALSLFDRVRYFTLYANRLVLVLTNVKKRQTYRNTW